MTFQYYLFVCQASVEASILVGLCMFGYVFDHGFAACRIRGLAYVNQWKESPLHKVLMFGACVINVCGERRQVHKLGKIKSEVCEKLGLAPCAHF